MFDEPTLGVFDEELLADMTMRAEARLFESERTKMKEVTIQKDEAIKPSLYYNVKPTRTGGVLSDDEDFDTVPPTEEDQMARHSWRRGEIQVAVGCLLLFIAVLTFGAIILTAFNLLACLIYFAGITAIAGLIFLVTGADNLNRNR